MSDSMKPPGSHVGPLALEEILDQAVQQLSDGQNEEQVDERAIARTMNALNQRELTPSQMQLAGQMRRVIRGERLSRKTGQGFFSIDTAGRKPR